MHTAAEFWQLTTSGVAVLSRPSSVRSGYVSRFASRCCAHERGRFMQGVGGRHGLGPSGAVSQQSAAGLNGTKGAAAPCRRRAAPPSNTQAAHCTTTGASVQLMADWAAFRHCLQPASRPGMTQSLRGCAAIVPALALGLAALAVRAGLRRALSWSMRCRSMRAPTLCPATAGSCKNRRHQ